MNRAVVLGVAFAVQALAGGCATVPALPQTRTAPPSGIMSVIGSYRATVGDFVRPPRLNVATGIGLVLELGGTGDHRPHDPKVKADPYADALDLAKKLHAELDIDRDPWNEIIPLEKVREFDIARVQVEAVIPSGAALGTNVDLRLTPVGNASDLDGGTLIGLSLTLEGSRTPLVRALGGTVQTSLDPDTKDYVWTIPLGGDLLMEPAPALVTLDCRALPRIWRLAILDQINNVYPGSVVDTAARLRNINLEPLVPGGEEGRQPVTGELPGAVPPPRAPGTADGDRAEGEVAESDVKALEDVFRYFAELRLGKGTVTSESLKIDIREIAVRLARPNAPPITLEQVLMVPVDVRLASALPALIVADRAAGRFGLAGRAEAYIGDAATVAVWSTGTGEDRRYDTFEFERPFFNTSVGEKAPRPELPPAASAVNGAVLREWVDKLSLRPPDIDYVDAWRGRYDSRIRTWFLSELGAIRMKQLVRRDVVSVTQPPGPAGGPLPPLVVSVTEESTARDSLVPTSIVPLCDILAADGLTFVQIETVLREAARAGAMSACVIEGRLPAPPDPERP